MRRYFNNSEYIQCQILHIEDNPGDVLLTQTYLKQAGFSSSSLVHVETLQAGIDQLKTDQEFDFILMDLSLPDSVGLETFETCVQHAKETPIIVLTGVTEKKLSKGLLDRGAYAFLQKDEVSESTLFNTIYGVLRRVLYEKELNELRKKAEGADAQKTRFLGLISHELRTPLSAIVGFAELLLDDPALGSKNLNAASRIKSNSLHLKTLVNDLVDLSEIELGKSEIQKTKIDVKRFLDDIIESIQIQGAKQNKRLTVISHSVLPTEVLSDQTKIRQILLNLLNNAIKFSGKGEVVMEITTKAAGENQLELQFQITDDGSGIPKENRQCLFQPYGRVHSMNEQRQGAGLGLALSQKLAQALGGDISLIYTGEQGTRFLVRLKIDLAQQNPQTFTYLPGTNFETDHKRSWAHTDDLKGLSVLIIEDAQDLRELYRLGVSYRGAEIVEVAKNATEGVDKAKNKEFSCVLLDLSLPDRDGFQVAKELRAAGYPGPIVALTAHAAPTIREKAFSTGFDALLTKPVAFDDLAKAIKSTQRTLRSASI